MIFEYLHHLIKQVTSTDQLLSELIRMQLPHELDIQNGAVYAKVTLQPGIKFGLSGIKWTENPLDKNVAWPVSYDLYIES